MQKILIVVDIQNDFVTGALGTAEAVAMLPAAEARIKAAKNNGERLIFTRDTHETNYMQTQEGKLLPVPHCIRGTEGWEIVPQLQALAEGCPVFDKPTFGSTELAKTLCAMQEEDPIEEITLIGICTDICVISNALLIKASLPEVPITVESACCAGVTPESHNNALSAMTMCQIAVK